MFKPSPCPENRVRYKGALAMAISNRKPKGRVVHHSDSECLGAGSLRVV